MWVFRSNQAQRPDFLRTDLKAPLLIQENKAIASQTKGTHFCRLYPCKPASYLRPFLFNLYRTVRDMGNIGCRPTHIQNDAFLSSGQGKAPNHAGRGSR